MGSDTCSVLRIKKKVHESNYAKFHTKPCGEWEMNWIQISAALEIPVCKKRVIENDYYFIFLLHSTSNLLRILLHPNIFTLKKIPSSLNPHFCILIPFFHPNFPLQILFTSWILEHLTIILKSRLASYRKWKKEIVATIPQTSSFVVLESKWWRKKENESLNLDL